MVMIKIRISDVNIEFATDGDADSEEAMLADLNRVMYFIIAIYKHRIEKKYLYRLSKAQEISIDNRIMEAFLIPKIDDIREMIEEK